MSETDKFTALDTLAIINSWGEDDVIPVMSHVAKSGKACIT